MKFMVHAQSLHGLDPPVTCLARTSYVNRELFHLQADFLATDTAAPEFADVQAVLLDPSCSGSGTAHSRMDFLLPSQWQSKEPPADEVRLRQDKHAAARNMSQKLPGKTGNAMVSAVLVQFCWTARPLRSLRAHHMLAG
jgi:hypothetical protein